jgi:two-component system sensor histidine kinase EvgS
VGISPERQQAVFAAYEQAEASTTRRFGGSGLGLSICRELAASMEAELCLRSAPGKGTTVWLELDLAPVSCLPRHCRFRRGGAATAAGAGAGC